MGVLGGRAVSHERGTPVCVSFIFQYMADRTILSNAAVGLGSEGPRAPAGAHYRGTSLMRNSFLPWDHHRTPGIVLLGSWGGLFLRSEVPLYDCYK